MACALSLHLIRAVVLVPALRRATMVAADGVPPLCRHHQWHGKRRFHLVAVLVQWREV